MKIDWSEPGLPLSAAAHAALLVVSLIGLSSAQPFADAEETLPVEIITSDQFSAMTKGEKTAKEVQPAPKPRIDKVAETEQLKPTQGADPTDVPTPPARAPEISDATSAPPLPPTRPPDPVKPEPKPEPQKTAEPQKPEPPKVDAEIPKPPEKPQPQKLAKAPDPPKESERPKPQPPQFDKIAQLLEQKKVEEQPKPVKPPAKEKGEPTFSTSAIEKLLVSKEKPQASGSVGAQLQKTASLGTQTGNAPKLSPSMRDALAGLLKDQVQKCFDIPPGLDETQIQQAQVRVVFKEDGSLAERPQVASSSSDPGVRAVAGALQRAIMRCAPYQIPAQFLPTFNEWKDTLFTPPESLG
ncbi:MAG: cell envelope integrity protein TolA [Hyphomicrobiales bacterium]|nr:cell envelope integrity protein TolA [Hyphomicrobiales bacterium]